MVVIRVMGIDKDSPFVGSVERLNKTGGVYVPVDQRGDVQSISFSLTVSTMESIYDELSKSLAASVPRRQSLRLLGAAIAGAVFSPWGTGLGCRVGPVQVLL